jgi:hypothetical protein
MRQSDTTMRKLFGSLILTAVLVAAVPGCGSEKGETGERAQRLAGKRILVVLPSNYFNDDEYRITRTVLENAGASVTVASSSIEVTTGMSGTEVKPDILLSDVNAFSRVIVSFNMAGSNLSCDLSRVERLEETCQSGCGEYWEFALRQSSYC